MAEALEKASLRLGIPQNQIRYKKLEGLYGSALKARKQAIIVELEQRDGGDGEAPRKKLPRTDEPRPEKEPGSAGWARYVLEGIFKRMGVEVIVGESGTEERVVFTVEITGEELDLRRGESRELRGAIQHLVNRSASGDNGERRFIIDIGGTLKGRSEKMIGLASRLGEKVLKMGGTIHVHMMDSQDRRLIHTSLQDVGSVDTRASGEKQFRVLTVGTKS